MALIIVRERCGRDELKRCPRCGEQPDLCTVNLDGERTFVVRCPNRCASSRRCRRRTDAVRGWSEACGILSKRRGKAEGIRQC